MSLLKEAANFYASSLNWHVFPLWSVDVGIGCRCPLAARCEHPGKHPRTPNGHLNASNDPAQIDAWWQEYPDANIGVSVEPSNLAVLDVDVKNGARGLESLQTLQIDLSRTLNSITGSRGLHAIYATQGERLPRRLNALGNDAAGRSSGIDFLTNGYFVAPPSQYITGRLYEWQCRVTTPLLPVPDILRTLSLARQAKEIDPVQVGAKISTGSRNNSLFRFAASLRGIGTSPEAIAAALKVENNTRFEEPLDAHEVQTILNSALRTVQPSRDLLQNAIVTQELHDALHKKTRPVALSEIASKELPAQECYPTGFPALDEMLAGGAHEGQVLGVVGPPSCGKSALVATWGLAFEAKRPVLHVSTELDENELMIRYAALKLGFPWRDGIKGRVQRETMYEAVNGLRIYPLGVDDIDRANPIDQIHNYANMLLEKYSIAPIIIVDYVQLLARGSGEQMRSNVGQLSMGFRKLSQELKTAIIAVFSTSRTYYGRKKSDVDNVGDNPTAYLGAAKESGDVEFDCAGMVYVDVDQMHEGLPKPARLVVARARFGEIGFAGALAHLNSGRWEPCDAALEKMSSNNRDSRDAVKKVEQNAKRLLKYIEKYVGRPWSEIRKNSHMATPSADTAYEWLMDNGKIYEEEITHDLKTMQKLRQKRVIIKVSDSVSATDMKGVQHARVTK